MPRETFWLDNLNGNIRQFGFAEKRWAGTFTNSPSPALNNDAYSGSTVSVGHVKLGDIYIALCLKFRLDKIPQNSEITFSQLRIAAGAGGQLYRDGPAIGVANPDGRWEREEPVLEADDGTGNPGPGLSGRSFEFGSSASGPTMKLQNNTTVLGQSSGTSYTANLPLKAYQADYLQENYPSVYTSGPSVYQENVNAYTSAGRVIVVDTSGTVNRTVTYMHNASSATGSAYNRIWSVGSDGYPDELLRVSNSTSLGTLSGAGSLNFDYGSTLSVSSGEKYFIEAFLGKDVAIGTTAGVYLPWAESSGASNETPMVSGARSSFGVTNYVDSQQVPIIYGAAQGVRQTIHTFPYGNLVVLSKQRNVHGTGELNFGGESDDTAWKYTSTTAKYQIGSGLKHLVQAWVNSSEYERYERQIALILDPSLRYGGTGAGATSTLMPPFGLDVEWRPRRKVIIS